ncbi:hypothetical protein HMPREF0293_0270 [Corynebacterium glucuronolyticum ATCC 51866]|uniref:Uncharacterized protein n=1 Tax=Corynebacterium glucuronolyticum ATCC 51866 TaxID=548478 RepID=A0ABM9XSL1_9CORY|nr:hypothetical protein HMPREF0293_0270 [Corynebacterium glucuronolyticum ATCC 51866]
MEASLSSKRRRVAQCVTARILSAPPTPARISAAAFFIVVATYILLRS